MRASDDIRATYAEPNSVHAAPRMNEGSKVYSGLLHRGPNPGRLRSFDRTAVGARQVERSSRRFTSPTNGCLCLAAGTIEELRREDILKGHEFQAGSSRRTVKETVARWNSQNVDKGQRSGLRARHRCALHRDRHAAVPHARHDCSLPKSGWLYQKRSPHQRRSVRKVI